MTSVLTVPLVVDGDAVGVVGAECPRFSADDPPSASDIERFRAVATLGAASIRNARLLDTIEGERLRLSRLLDQRRQLRHEVGHLREQARQREPLEDLIGTSDAFREVLSQIELVAPADSTVLLVGDTGTGKEVLAHALHGQSRRCGRPFVAVNCAALPESLVESELFGYERGAFTGALTRKPGKFELADSGTIFLDEIGDLPLQAQAKLLRVLQEREVQRVGGTRSQSINVRVISATNQDLATCMGAGRFRPDLFYRLSVFPVRVPSLRERRDDVPLLVDHFLQRFAERQHKSGLRLASGVMKQLAAYDWPGNVRELQNVIERAVILARGPSIDMELISLQPNQAADSHPAPAQELSPQHVDAEDGSPAGDNMIRFADAERHAIARALALSGWRISGRHGAADILGLKPTTLHAKMKRLGIHRPTVATVETAAHA
jgi:transcriptional regulator with GAF, ATPase, and Fis domain